MFLKEKVQETTKINTHIDSKQQRSFSSDVHLKLKMLY